MDQAHVAIAHQVVLDAQGRVHAYMLRHLQDPRLIKILETYIGLLQQNNVDDKRRYALELLQLMEE